MDLECRSESRISSMQWDHMGPVSVVKFTKCSPISTPKNKGFKTFQVKHCHLTRTGPVTHRLMPQIQSHHISPHLAVHQTSKQISADQSRPFKSLQVLQYPSKTLLQFVQKTTEITEMSAEFHGPGGADHTSWRASRVGYWIPNGWT